MHRHIRIELCIFRSLPSGSFALFSPRPQIGDRQTEGGESERNIKTGFMSLWVRFSNKSFAIERHKTWRKKKPEDLSDILVHSSILLSFLPPVQDTQRPAAAGHVTRAAAAAAIYLVRFTFCHSGYSGVRHILIGIGIRWHLKEWRTCFAWSYF